MTKAQKKLLDFINTQDGWFYYRDIPFDWQSRTMNALIDRGLVERGSYGEFRAVAANNEPASKED